MASEVIQGNLKVVVMSRHDAVEIIALLSAQLGNVTLDGRVSGAAPGLTITDRGHTLYRMLFLIEQEIQK